MPTYNLQAMADKIRYLQYMGLNESDARTKALNELGIDQMPESVSKELDFLLTNPSLQSKFARNDKDKIIDRMNAGANVATDTNPRFETNEADAGAK